MKTNIILIIAFVIAGFAASYYLSSTKPSNMIDQVITENPQVLPLPPFSFTTLGGKSYESNTFAGKTMMINFWATWCAPCIIEFPMLLDIAQNNKDKLVFIAISSDSDKAAIERFFNKLGQEHQKILQQDNVFIVRDKNSALTFDVFQTAKLPETIIVSPQQKMLKKLVGADWKPEDITRYIHK